MGGRIDIFEDSHHMFLVSPAPPVCFQFILGYVFCFSPAVGAGGEARTFVGEAPVFEGS